MTVLVRSLPRWARLWGRDSNSYESSETVPGLLRLSLIQHVEGRRNLGNVRCHNRNIYCLRVHLSVFLDILAGGLKSSSCTSMRGKDSKYLFTQSFL